MSVILIRTSIRGSKLLGTGTGGGGGGTGRPPTLCGGNGGDPPPLPALPGGGGPSPKGGVGGPLGLAGALIGRGGDGGSSPAPKSVLEGRDVAPVSRNGFLGGEGVLARRCAEKSPNGDGVLTGVLANLKGRDAS